MKTENVTYLLGAYFHQNWFFENLDPDDVIKSFIARESSERVSALEKEITFLLANNDELPGSFIINNNGYYDPSADGLTVNKWLQHILSVLP
ncbi:contact-dependent growth inhibition system immunity protein [Erwinia sp.]|uniref:contact-dependent growth inhibition system immunity protein n=1 Tax=Erwinia citreus TaxID=558 RepID=UPI003C74F85B